MAQPIRTSTAKQIIEALDARLDELRSIDLDEADTFTRRDVRARIDEAERTKGVVRSLLPYVESDAVTLAATSRGEVIGIIEAERQLDFGTPSVDDPSDITLPFVRHTVAGVPASDEQFMRALEMYGAGATDAQVSAAVLSGRAHL